MQSESQANISTKKVLEPINPISLRPMLEGPKGWIDTIWLPDINKIFLISKEKIQLRDPKNFTLVSSKSYPILKTIESSLQFQKLIHLPAVKLILFNAISRILIIRYLPDLRIVSTISPFKKYWDLCSCTHLNQQLILIGGNSKRIAIINRKTGKLIKRLVAPFNRDIYCTALCYVPASKVVLAAETCGHPEYHVAAINVLPFKGYKHYDEVIGQSNLLINIEKHRVLITFYHNFSDSKTQISLIPYCSLPGEISTTKIRLQGNALEGCFAIIEDDYIAIPGSDCSSLEIYSLETPSTTPVQVFSEVFDMNGKNYHSSLIYNPSTKTLLAYSEAREMVSKFVYVNK